MREKTLEPMTFDEVIQFLIDRGAAQISYKADMINGAIRFIYVVGGQFYSLIWFHRAINEINVTGNTI